jgi:hypothetical protein
MNKWNSKRIKIIQPTRGLILAQRPSLSGLVAYGRGQRAVTAGAADDGWPVLVAELGRR